MSPICSLLPTSFAVSLCLWRPAVNGCISAVASQLGKACRYVSWSWTLLVVLLRFGAALVRTHEPALSDWNTLDGIWECPFGVKVQFSCSTPSAGFWVCYLKARALYDTHPTSWCHSGSELTAWFSKRSALSALPLGACTCMLPKTLCIGLPVQGLQASTSHLLLLACRPGLIGRTSPSST